ncbi:hypothetical protein HYQ44_008406 [Verticillium longisporum]|nr:hypothetical protein HYQ44_008406 [Verticillium longisporum]
MARASSASSRSRLSKRSTTCCLRRSGAAFADRKVGPEVSNPGGDLNSSKFNIPVMTISKWMSETLSRIGATPRMEEVGQSGHLIGVQPPRLLAAPPLRRKSITSQIL